MRNDGPLKISFNILVCFVSRQPSVASQNLLATISEAKLTPTSTAQGTFYNQMIIKKNCLLSFCIHFTFKYLVIV